MTQNWCPNGVPKLSKIVKTDVLGQPLHTGGSKVASRPLQKLILDRFWDDLGTIFDRLSNTIGVTSTCVV